MTYIAISLLLTAAALRMRLVRLRLAVQLLRHGNRCLGDCFLASVERERRP